MVAITAEELIGENLKLVSLPAVVTRINELLNEPNATAADIAHYISQDTALTAQLLKLVNSPFYSFPSKVDTISMAVTILGTRQLRDLVIATTVVSHFVPDPNVDFDIETFWCHSITTGIAARVIALSLKIPNSERLFISGLLHDIGKMIMSILLPRETESLNMANQATISRVSNDIEKQIFGFTHAELGQVLLDSWQFPQTISQPIAHHHDMQCDEAFNKDTAVLHIANVIANNIQAPVSRDDDTILMPEALEIMKLDQRAVEAYYQQVYELLDDILQLLYYDIAA